MVIDYCLEESASKGEARVEKGNTPGVGHSSLLRRHMSFIRTWKVLGFWNNN